LPRKQIAHKMKIDIRSIEGYLTTLKKNFGVESVYALIAVLFRKGKPGLLPLCITDFHEVVRK